ncbi:MAG TPA: hypothetical protein VNA44_11915 [Burkholderiaceae bacterium]|nr:hypothetical protein [Burkholderiaceae bacterium]
MKEFRFTTCDVFTDRMFSGNPLAVLTARTGSTIKRCNRLRASSISRKRSRSSMRPLGACECSRQAPALPKTRRPVQQQPRFGVVGASRPASIRHSTLDRAARRAVGRPSQIELKADVRDGIVQAVRVGGATVLVSEGVLRL